MIETYRMLGRERQADLEREAERLHRAAPFRRQRRHVARALVAPLAITVALLLVWLFALPS
jgi:ferric-dicitrate binding protein FerR (iron transport regulator)